MRKALTLFFHFTRIRTTPMRHARLKAPVDHPAAYYHCVSRVVNRDFIFGDVEKEVFRKLMRKYEQFCGVRVVTFCVMSNHFHVLLEVPKRPEQMPSDAELVQHVRALGGSASGTTLAQLLERLRADGSEGATAAAEALRETYFERMWDVSAYMKALKQRFSVWYNKEHGRKGTLWEERFKSVLVEGSGDALATMAAYVDLNPVRAGMVEDPKDYRWCGYAEAVSGRKAARIGLGIVTSYLKNEVMTGKAAILSVYRRWLYGQGEEKGLIETGAPLRRGFTRAAIEEVLASKGQLSRSEMIRCRVRYFADGCVIGSKGFVDRIFEANRERFGPKRKDGGRKMQSAQPALYTLRALQVDVYA